jgi:Protein of unknown function (DUF2950)
MTRAYAVKQESMRGRRGRRYTCYRARCAWQVLVCDRRWSAHRLEDGHWQVDEKALGDRNAQGPDAPGGAYDYLVNGNRPGGFALVAYDRFL